LAIECFPSKHKALNSNPRIAETKQNTHLGEVAFTCNPSCSGDRDGRIVGQGQHGKNVYKKIISQRKSWVWCYTSVILAMQEEELGRLESKAGPGQKMNEKNETTRAGTMAQGVDYLSGKCKTLSSNLSHEKRQKPTKNIQAQKTTPKSMNQ
jgi:hypothetical protein